MVATAALAVSLVLGGMPALAQEDSEEPPDQMVFVTGTEVCLDRTPWEPFSPQLNTTSVRDAETTCIDQMSDPRVSGEWTNTMDMDCYGDEFCLLSGTHVIVKEEGGWDCTWTASNFPTAEADASGERPYLIIGVCPGTGGFEGLSYVFQHTSWEFPGDTSFHGVIYEGLPPAAFDVLGSQAE
jgi:hypothetical protein